MALYTRIEFCQKCNLTSGNLSNYIKRGQVVINDATQLIDDKQPTNILFVNRRIGKGTANAPAPEPATLTPKKRSTRSRKKAKPKKKKIATNRDDFEEDEMSEEIEAEDDIAKSIIESEVKLKKFKAHNAELDNLLKQQELDKKLGKVIPSEPIIPVIKQHNMAILTAMKNAFEAILAEICHKYEISSEDMAAYRGVIYHKCNHAMDEALEMSEKGLADVLDAYITIKK